jgi:hypothetical protein
MDLPYFEEFIAFEIKNMGKRNPPDRINVGLLYKKYIKYIQERYNKQKDTEEADILCQILDGKISEEESVRLYKGTDDKYQTNIREINNITKFKFYNKCKKSDLKWIRENNLFYFVFK